MAAALPAVAPIRFHSLVRRRKSSNSPESRARERVKKNSLSGARRIDIESAAPRRLSQQAMAISKANEGWQY
ncbi:hypothetical protein BURPS668_A1801 [Burkholderia pseudomallei 668]|nr:hypothetical protein BURPS668_A1801 [Burkholderia pseudomallei 668]